jgi:uncharacterized phage protein gp47/JayE
MATPTPRSYEQLLSDALSTYMSKIGVNDMNVGSAVTSFFEAVAQMVYLANASNFSILRDFNLDRATGEALKRIATEERVNPLPARVSTGRISIRDLSFSKISTKVYAGSTAPNIGSISINVSDATLFPPTGSIYIGRGTNNIEGPLAYSSITPVGGFFQINLTSPTTKYHNNSENVILAQGGNRSIPAGSAVVAPASGGAEDVNFTTTQSATLLDGESEIFNVTVAAQKPGSQGNVSRGSIKRFISEPFTGASATNTAQFTTGRDEESDLELRARVKRARLSKGLGTSIAVKNSVLDQQAPDEAATVVSAEIFSSVNETILYIDNGDGYEEKSQGVGIEFILDRALGGETNFQLATGGEQTSIAKAFIESDSVFPFDVKGGDTLALSVGGVVTEHVFSDKDFRSPGFATSYEIVSSVNSNPNIKFSGRTSDNFNRVAFFAKTEEREYIQKSIPTSGRDSGELIGLPSNEIETLRIYKNGKILSKNGRFANIESENQQQWATNITSGDTLALSVDNTQLITYTFSDSDFIEEGSFLTVNRNNSLGSWANVINAKITGITATVIGTKLQLTSNLGANNRAAINIDQTSTLVSKGMFTISSGLSSAGKEADFVLSRNTAQLKLLKPLRAGDSLSAGTGATKANIVSGDIAGGTVNFSSDALLWFLVDVPEAKIISTGVSSDTLLSVSKPSANVVRYTSSVPNAFGAVFVGDWVIVRSEELSLSNRIEGRVHAITATTLDVKITPTEYLGAIVEGPIVFQGGFTIVRTEKAVQKIKIPSGVYSLFQVAEFVEKNLIGVTSVVVDEQNIIITTKKEDNDGGVLIVDFNDSSEVLNFKRGQFSQSDFSLFGFYESSNSESGFPIFIHSKATSDENSDPPDTLIDSFNSDEDLDSLGVVEINFVCGVQPFNAPQDSAINNECTQIDLINGSVVDLDDNLLLRRIRVNDRYYLTLPYDFSDSDSLVVVMDGDASSKTFQIPLYRPAIVNNTSAISAISFRAYDSNSGPTTEFFQFFNSDFNFKNYKVMMKARNVIHPTSSLVDEDAVLIRSAQMGLSGEKTRVAYKYPTQSNLEITHTVTISDLTKISIFLKSGNPVTNTVDGTTEWDITIVPMAGYDEVTYSWNGNGTNPNISVELSSGGYVSIGKDGEFDVRNTGVFRVESATSQSFTVTRPTNAAIAESNRATLTNETIRLYEAEDTTAQELVDYINNELVGLIEASIIDDNGTSGSGIINRSTHEDSIFIEEYVNLVDGQNYILSSDLSAASPAPQFTFKKPLVLPFYSTATVNAYTFNSGEVLKFIPTTAKQLESFINTLAVSGVSTDGSIKATSREKKIQIMSDTLGSKGAVHVVGGRGNLSTAEIIQAASRTDSNFTRVVVERPAISGMHGDQWVKLQAKNLQIKNTNFTPISILDVTPNSPIAGKTSITLSNRQPENLFFGKPRNFIRDRSVGFRVEKHGSLTAIMWNENGPSPRFSKTVSINNLASGVIDVDYNEDNGYTKYTAAIGTRLFFEAGINDTLTVEGFLDPSNNGSFRVVGVSDDGRSVIVDNFYGVDEFGTIIGTSDISVEAEIQEGDTVYIDSPFNVLNRGSFRVIRRFNDTFWIENTNSVEEDVIVAANLLSLTVDGITEFDITTISGGTKIEWNGNGTDPSLGLAKVGDVIYLGTDFDADNQGSYTIIAKELNAITVENSMAVDEVGIQITDQFEIHRPSLRFYDYEVTVENDHFVVGGDILTENSIGSYRVDEVYSQNQIIVDGILNSASSLTLGNKSIEIFVEEQLVYSGYKQVHNKSLDPANINQGIVIFKGFNQFLKINRDAGAVSVFSIGKLEFPTTIRRGLDSYRYHTGLLRQANKVVYGDPRGSEYEGVSAAGAEIFIQPPLIRRIEMSIVVRLNTGIAFSKIAEQVRSNVSSLIGSGGIGQSIPLSDVISTVNAIPGVFAVSIASPSYNSSSDLIVINPSEKPLILDPIADIIVSRIGGS